MLKRVLYLGILIIIIIIPIVYYSINSKFNIKESVPNYYGVKTVASSVRETTSILMTPKPSQTLIPSKIHVNANNLQDIKVDIGKNTLNSIKNGACALIPFVDYTVSGNTVVINKGYLKYYFTKFPNQNLNIDFDSNGNNEILTVYTGDTCNVLLTDEISYKLGSGDGELNLVLNGNFITSVKNGDDLLVKYVDYAYSNSLQVFYLKREYLNSYFSKTSKPLKLTFDFSRESRTVIIIPVK